jgi:hypothetical protein
MDCSRCLEENKKSGEINGYGYIGKEHNCQRHTNKSDIDNSQTKGLKWTDGQPYERSRRMKHQIEMENQKFSKDMESSAYNSSLHHDENTWDILNQSLSSAGFKASNKREELGNKLAGREMIQQIGFNPFLGQTNYIDDISIRDQFLKPMNTTHDDTKAPFS